MPANPIQITIFIQYTLKEYYSQVRGRRRDVVHILGLPYDFKERCPLCGGKGCAKFIGYYYRCVVDEKGTYFKAFPIARYLCRGRGTARIVKHRTFSLLPYQLVSYSKYSIPFIINALKRVYCGGSSVERLLDYLASFEPGQYIDLSASAFYAFRSFILKCINKLLAVGFYKEARELSGIQSRSDNQRIKVFLVFAEEFTCSKIDPAIRGPCALGYDYYIKGGGHIKNGHFLFGTPSQFR